MPKSELKPPSLVLGQVQRAGVKNARPSARSPFVGMEGFVIATSVVSSLPGDHLLLVRRRTSTEEVPVGTRPHEAAETDKPAQ
jgi:hypothetical protein